MALYDLIPVLTYWLLYSHVTLHITSIHFVLTTHQCHSLPWHPNSYTQDGLSWLFIFWTLRSHRSNTSLERPCLIDLSGSKIITFVLLVVYWSICPQIVNYSRTALRSLHILIMWWNVSPLKPKEYYQDIGLTFTQCRYHFYIILDWVIIQEHLKHLQWWRAHYLMKQLIPSWDSSTCLKSILYIKLNLSSCNFHPLPFGVIPSKSNSLYKSRPIPFRKQL